MARKSRKSPADPGNIPVFWRLCPETFFDLALREPILPLHRSLYRVFPSLVQNRPRSGYAPRLRETYKFPLIK
jgi:hypothetical protein